MLARLMDNNNKIMQDVSMNLKKNNEILNDMNCKLLEMQSVKKSIEELNCNLLGQEKCKDVEKTQGDIPVASRRESQSNNMNMNRSYLTVWKEIGGNALHFTPGGSLHPVAFIKKLSEFFLEAEVPESRRVSLAVAALRGSAAAWGQVKEPDLRSFADFDRAFVNRYWSVEIERETFTKLKFGAYENGSKADYFLKQICDLQYLSHKMSEKEKIEMIVNHFPYEIQRGILNSGLFTIDGVEQYLRKTDRLEEGEAISRNARFRNFNRPPNSNNFNQPRDRENRNISRGQTNNEPVPRRENEIREPESNSAQVRISTLFSESPESVLLSESEVKIEKILSSPIIHVTVETISTKALIDSGSQITCISQEFLMVVLNKNSKLPVLNTNCITVTGALRNKSSKVRQQVYLNVKFAHTEWDVAAVVVPGLVRDLILGADWLTQFEVVLDFANYSLSGVFGESTVSIPFSNEVGESAKVQISEVEAEADEIGNYREVNNIVERKKLKVYSDEQLKKIIDNAELLQINEKTELFHLLDKYRDVFSEQPGRLNCYEHEIVLRDYTPFFIKSYPIAQIHRAEIDRQVKEMIEWGVIREQQTEYVSPLVVVTKKDGSPRVCLDARFLNKRMVMDHVMPPNPSELLFHFVEGQCLSKLDMTSSYWQVPIKESHRKYTGFLYQGRTYVFNVLPFGLCTSVGSFIRGLNIVLGGEMAEFLVLYVDDILIFSRDIQSHYEHLALIFKKLIEAGVTIKLRKCQFACKRIEFLGHILTPTGIEIDPNRVSAIQNFRAPRNVKELRSFLGLINYERRFCNQLAELTVPLLRLLKRGNRWRWTDIEHEAFQNLKEVFLKLTVLHHPKETEEYFVQTDASNHGIGACLFQLGLEGERKIIAYSSRTLKGPELAYSVTEKEALAVVYALRQWRVFLLGRAVTVITDHKAISFLNDCRFTNARLTRWILYLQEFNLKIKYCRGKDNVTADVLSRFPENQNHHKREYLPIAANVSVGVAIFQKEHKQLVTKIKSLFKDLRVLQENDTFLKTVRSHLNQPQGSERYTNWYLVHDGYMFRRSSANNSGYRLCIPKELVLPLVKHEHETNGHFGELKCHLFLSKFYFWPHMRKIIRKIIAGCLLCQKSKISKRCRGEYHSIIADKPNELVFVDLMGPLPMSRGGVTQLFVVVDAFSKHVSVYPLRRATAKAVLKCLTEKYFKDVGKPDRILSDNGTQFTGRSWHQTLEGLGIKVMHTSAYYPQGNPTERVNREIGRLLRAFCHSQHSKWAVIVKTVEGWLNQVIHSCTGFTPNELHFGRERSNEFIKSLNFPGVLERLPKDVIILARERLRSKAALRAKQVKPTEHTAFKPGDKVLVRTHPISSLLEKEIKKFFLLYRGPCTVIRQAGANAYEIQEDSTGHDLGIHNIYNLKPFRQQVNDVGMLNSPM